MRPLAVLHAKEDAGRWYGVACVGEALLATTVAPTREEALRRLRRSLPSRVDHKVGADDESAFAEKTIAMLVELEAGEERRKALSLDRSLVGEPLASVLAVAAAIPLGYVTTYGKIARAAGAEARDVGGIMASNPLYPIVACHRVVGADLSLVGYAGSTGADALRNKLERLTRETQGYGTEREIDVAGRPLTLYPVEWAIAKAEGRPTGRERQRRLFD